MHPIRTFFGREVLGVVTLRGDGRNFNPILATISYPGN